MGISVQYPRSIKEIEKSHTIEEILRLILFDNLYYYPQNSYSPDKLCENCKKIPITKQHQISGNKFCLNCYNSKKNVFFEQVKNSIQTKEFKFEGKCIINDKLYLGNLESSYCKDTLKKLGITHILMTCYDMTPIFPDDFVYENIEVNDYKYENILQYLVKGIEFIEQSKICYVHCRLGISRSATFVLAYVMYKYRVHLYKAMDYVFNKRPKINPNEGFQIQLSDFDLILYHFEYDLDKCDNFIKNYFEQRGILEIKEKDFLEKRFEQKKKKELEKQKKKNLNNNTANKVDANKEDLNKKDTNKEDVNKGELKEKVANKEIINKEDLNKKDLEKKNINKENISKDIAKIENEKNKTINEIGQFDVNEEEKLEE